MPKKAKSTGKKAGSGMPKKKAKKARAKAPGFEEKIDNFAEELGHMGEEFGKKAEAKGKEIEKSWHNTFGFISPLIASIFGIIIFVIGIWVLRFLSVETSIGFLSALSDFILINLGLFFLLFILFGYADFFSNHYKKAFMPFSPIVKAAGITLFVWILANAVLIANPGLGIFSGMAEYIIERISWLFIFFAFIAYVFFLIAKNSKQEARAMKKAGAKAKQETPEIKRLYRSGKNKLVGGVCSGIAGKSL